jgi:hypothetical protein
MELTTTEALYISPIAFSIEFDVPHPLWDAEHSQKRMRNVARGTVGWQAIGDRLSMALIGSRQV